MLSLAALTVIERAFNVLSSVLLRVMDSHTEFINIIAALSLSSR